MFPEYALFIAIGVFVWVLSAIVFEYMDRALAVLVGVLILVFSGTLSPLDMFPLINTSTIFLLIGMMIIVEVVQESRLFAWLNVKIVESTKGSPLVLFFLFSGLTFFLSTFLANATTMMILIPLTITITRGMGIDPKPYLISEIIFSDIGGALTLIGDPTNVMIGAANHFSFMDFFRAVAFPIAIVSVVTIGILVWKDWKKIRPIRRDIPKLFMSHLLMTKVQNEFQAQPFSLSFALITAGVLLLTILGLIFNFFSLPIEHIALFGGITLLLVTQKYIKIPKNLNSLDWHMIFFFSGLFIIVGTLEKVGALEHLSDFILQYTTSAFTLCLAILWTIGLLSAFIENIPLVAMMIPVLNTIIASGAITGNVEIAWFALSMGACLGGNGSLIGSSANMIGAQLSERNGVKISFLEFFKYGYPLTILALGIGSVYFYFVT